MHAMDGKQNTPGKSNNKCDDADIDPAYQIRGTSTQKMRWQLNFQHQPSWETLFVLLFCLTWTKLLTIPIMFVL